MGKAKILIVEDEYIIAEDMRQKLHALGYEVAGIVNNGRQAIEMTGEHRPDLVLMDIVIMGEMDGIETARALGERFGSPVVFISSLADDAVLQRVKTSESFGYIIKPFNDQELLFTIEMALYRGRVDRELKRTHDHMKMLLESARAVPWEYDVRLGKYTYVGPQAERILGIAPDTWMEGGPGWFAKGVAQEDRRQFEDSMALALKSGLDYEIEYRMNNATGDKVHWVRDVVSAVHGPGGLEALRGLVIDITARRMAEEALVESEGLLKAIFDNASVGILLCDIPSERLDMCNRKFATMMGYSESELVGLSVQSLQPKQEGDEMATLFQAHAQGKHGFARDIPMLRKDGTVFYADISTSGLTVGGRARLLAFFRDVTDRLSAEREMRAARDKAEAALEAKGRFLADISHEIRTPMHGIIGLTDLLLEGVEGSAHLEHLRLIKNSSETLLGLIDDLLDLSRIEAGAFQLAPMDFGLRNILQDTVSLYAAVARKHSTELSLHVDPETPDYLRGDPVRFRQVLQNLIGNAVKFTEGGRIDVRAELISVHDGSIRLRFRVADTGIGISPDMLDKVFDAFTQGGGAIADRHRGTGLGLAIASRIVSLMGGDIEVRSAEGQGSEFIFTAVFEAAHSDPAADACPTHTGSGRRFSILLCDDNAINLKVAARILQKAGHEVETAQDGQTAYEMAISGDYDLVLMDVRMPGMDGIEVSRLIRKWEAEQGSPRRPIVAMTAHSVGEYRSECMGAGMDDYITKPIKASELISVINQNARGG